MSRCISYGDIPANFLSLPEGIIFPFIFGVKHATSSNQLQDASYGYGISGKVSHVFLSFSETFSTTNPSTTVLPGIAKMAWLDDEEVDFHYLCSSQVIEGSKGRKSGISLIYLPQVPRRMWSQAPYQSQDDMTF